MTNVFDLADEMGRQVITSLFLPLLCLTMSVPKVMRMIFLHTAEGPGKESGGSRQVEGEPRYTV